MNQQLKAYKYLQLYKSYTDSVSLDKSDLKNTDIDHFFTVHDQQFRLAILNNNDELKNAYLIAVVLFLILSVSIAVITWYYLKRSRENINKLTRLNNQMTDTLIALESSQADNSRIMAIVAHDLRNPIGAMATAATMVMEDDTLLSEDSYQLLELIKMSGNNSLKLVNELLSVNLRPDDPGKKPEDLRELLQHCVELLNHKATAKKHQLLLEGPSVIVNLNREKMWRVISNLIANAIKFSPEQTVIIIRIAQQQDSVIIEVKDQGIGIPESLKDKIFEMQAGAKRKGTAGEESFGLGLSIAKQIVESHAGKIWFESDLGKGTTFYVQLPIDN